MFREKDKFLVDMCRGPLFRNVILFAIPLLLTNLLQLLFHAADLVVIGHYASHEAMAAIGCTASMNNLFINIFIGISVGANVLASKYFGANDPEKIRKTVHTALTFSFFGGILLMFFALAVAKPILRFMGTPEEILPMSCTYIWICFLVIPFTMLYNFGCSILRAVGDTRRPFIYLVSAGIINVLLNLFFVIVCGMDVEGVAIATAVSHVVAAFLIIRALLKSRESFRFQFRYMGIDRQILKEMMGIGIPAGVQSSCFSFSNMVIQSSINSFGTLAMAGMTASLGLECLVYVGANAFHYTAISFVAQNLGARHFKRILHSIYCCYFCGATVCCLFGWFFYLLGEFFLSVYNPDPAVIEWGLLRMKILFTTYLLVGFMDVASGGLRGLGYSLLSTVISLSGACFFRIFWVMVIFPHYKSMECLLISYPVSWGLVAIFGSIALSIVYRKTVRTECPRLVEWSKLGPAVPKGFRFMGFSK